MLQVNLDEFRRHEGASEINLNEGRRAVTKGGCRRRLFDWLSRESLRHLNLLRTREREHSRGNVLSLQQMPRGPAGGWKRAKLKTPAGYIRKSSSKCSKHWMNISTRGAFRLRIRMQMRAKRMNTWALLIAQTRERG
ncbi:MAG: hypothetical protein ACTS6P_02120 [Candidatus Hodgkinia cicadicola]